LRDRLRSQKSGGAADKLSTIHIHVGVYH
jgi:hypothetical protein